jgi:hypothetical protein
MQSRSTKMSSKGIYTDNEMIANFSAKIIEEIVVYKKNAVDIEERLYKIIARCNDDKKTFELSEREFNNMAWHNKQLGAGAIIYPGHRNKELVKCTIQENSKNIVVSKRFTCLGFISIEGIPAFLHGDGILTPESEPISNVSVDLCPNLKLNALKSEEIEYSLRSCLKKTLRFLDFCDNEILNTILLSAPFRAVLANFKTNTVSLFILGETGAHKSSAAALAQSFFASEYTDENLPVNMV